MEYDFAVIAEVAPVFGSSVHGRSELRRLRDCATTRRRIAFNDAAVTAA